ncbi:MAG: hypothetical protein LBC31_02245 [Treponema sp.]|jgi:antitoxin component of MazEF toxin-antitoxin module|nr:hypothetical protein [Treponema sp.]
MRLKVIPHGDSIAMVFDQKLREKLKLTPDTEFEYRIDGTRLILYPQDNNRETAESGIL